MEDPLDTNIGIFVVLNVLHFKLIEDEPIPTFLVAVFPPLGILYHDVIVPLLLAEVNISNPERGTVVQGMESNVVLYDEKVDPVGFSCILDKTVAVTGEVGSDVPPDFIVETLYVYELPVVNPESSYVTAVVAVLETIVSHDTPKSTDLSILYPNIVPLPVVGAIQVRCNVFTTL